MNANDDQGASRKKTVTFSRSATLRWDGDVLRGTGTVAAATGAFSVGATFPTMRGESAGLTTPEELLAASHAVCFGIGVRSVIGRTGGSARHVETSATITAEKGSDGIRVKSSRLRAVVTGLEGISPEQLRDIGTLVEKECTISAAIGGSVEITHEIVAAENG
jgi:lipoyl-dependent peroxiredoxin